MVYRKPACKTGLLISDHMLCIIRLQVKSANGKKICLNNGKIYVAIAI